MRTTTYREPSRTHGDPELTLTEPKNTVIELKPMREADIVWQCDCGAQLFYVRPDCFECSDCGTIQEF